MKRCLLSGIVVVAVVFGTSCTSSVPSTTHVAPTGGDPAVYAAAIAEIQSYLTTWVKLGPEAAAASYLTVAPEEQMPLTSSSISSALGSSNFQPDFPSQPPGLDAEMPVLIEGSVSSYVPWTWDSADHFMLNVTLDLHFSGDPGRANWYQGHNTQFFTFSRVPPQTRWRMETATGP